MARGLILVPERRELFAAMSVADNLELGGFQRAMARERGWRSTQDEIYERFPRLKERGSSSPERCRAASDRCSRWAAR